jgi:hypothetical protein
MSFSHYSACPGHSVIIPHRPSAGVVAHCSSSSSEAAGSPPVSWNQEEGESGTGGRDLILIRDFTGGGETCTQSVSCGLLGSSDGPEGSFASCSGKAAILLPASVLASMATDIFSPG